MAVQQIDSESTRLLSLYSHVNIGISSINVTNPLQLADQIKQRLTDEKSLAAIETIAMILKNISNNPSIGTAPRLQWLKDLTLRYAKRFGSTYHDFQADDIHHNLATATNLLRDESSEGNQMSWRIGVIFSHKKQAPEFESISLQKHEAKIAEVRPRLYREAIKQRAQYAPLAFLQTAITQPTKNKLLAQT